MLTAPATDLSLTVKDEVFVRASLEHTFDSVLAHMGRLNETPDGKPFPMTLEPRPGGRWFRDLGEGAGHFWGHVQVIKPPGLVELCGPMFMSFPAVNHVQYRLTAEGDVTRLKFTHRAMGPIPDEFRENIGTGWDFGLNQIAAIASALVAKRKGVNGR